MSARTRAVGGRDRDRSLEVNGKMKRAPGTAGRTRAHGQTLVLFVLAIAALLAGVALVVDGGNAFAQQRETQNAVDASADAGAVVLVRNIAAQTLTNPPATDGDVLAAVDAAASNNGIATPVAYYTTITGRCILADGSTATPPCNTLADAVRVGSGSIPTVNADASGNPQCPLPYGTAATTPAPACGVAVYGSKSFGTYVAGAVGIRRITAGASATAVAGATVSICPAGSPCGFLPVTFPTALTACGSTNKLNFGKSVAYEVATPPLTAANESTVPICGTGPGSVGWLAIQPEDTACGGGVNDLACDIQTPDNPPLFLPLWLQAQTGNTNSVAVENAMNSYAGSIVGTYEPGKDQEVIIPLYDCTADVKVVGGQQNPATNPASCSGLSSQDLNGGTGSGLYYHIPSIAGFVLDHAYIQGGQQDKLACNSAPGTPVGGNGGTGCLKGWFVNISSPTTAVGTGYGNPTTAYGVQLIR